MVWSEIVADGRKWIAVAMVVSALIFYLGFTKSYRECVDSMEDTNFAHRACHMKGG